MPFQELEAALSGHQQIQQDYIGQGVRRSIGIRAAPLQQFDGLLRRSRRVDPDVEVGLLGGNSEEGKVVVIIVHIEDCQSARFHLAHKNRSGPQLGKPLVDFSELKIEC